MAASNSSTGTDSLNSSSNFPADSNRKKDSKNTGLKKCFSALVDRKQVNLELEVLRLMLRKELQINLESFDPDLANILPYMLVHYIKSWPGWQRSVEYYSGNIPFKNWYDKFHKFITLKLSEAIKTHYQEAIAEAKKDKISSTRRLYMLKKVADKNTQTDSLAPKVVAPFSIDIMAKPVLLNTIVFTDSNESDVILKQHSVLEWDNTVSESITLKQLITWPHVGIHMLSPIFSFTRRNLHEFRRHVSLVGTPLPSTTVEYIEEVKILLKKQTRQCFTHSYMKKMFSEFMEAFTNVQKFQKTPDSTGVIEVFQTVIDEFLLDIEEIEILRDNKPTIASNTSVLFNIGKHSYFRNKKLSKGAPSRMDLGYTEVVIPKMEVALAFILSENEIDTYINHLKSIGTGDNVAPPKTLPQITYSCSYCKLNFDHGGVVAAHLKEEHKMEQPMLCTQCKKSFPPFQLTKTRWGHSCSVPAKSRARTSV